MAFAGLLAAAEGHEDGDGALDAGESVAGEGFADAVGAAVGIAAQVGVADHRLNVQAEGAVAAVGAFESEGGHAQHDQAGVDLAEFVPADAGAVDGLGDVVFDQDVALFDEFEEGFAAFRGHNVAGHGALVAGVGVEGGEAVPGVVAEFGVGVLGLHAALRAALHLLAGGGVFGAAGVGLDAVDGFDLDDVGAPFGEQLGDVGAGPDDGDGGDAQAFEGEGERIAGSGGAGFGVERREVEDGAGVFAEVGGAAGRVGGGGGEAEGVAGVGQGRAVPVGDFVPPAAGLQLRVVEEVGGGHDGAGEQADRLGFGDDVELGAVGEEVGDGLVNLVAEAADRAVGFVDRLEQVGALDPFEQAGQAEAGANDADEAIGAREDAEADPAAAGSGAAGGDAAVGGGGEVDGAAVAAAGLAAEDADVDPVAGAAVVFGAAQGEQDGERGGGAGVVVGVVAGDFERLAVGGAGGVEGSADGLEGEFGAAVVAVGAGLSEGGDGAEDEAGVEGVEDVPAPAGGGGFAGRAVFDDGVYLAGEAANGGRAVVGVRIEDDRFLVGVEVEEEAGGFEVGLVVGEGAELPRGVAAAGFDFDHARAEVGEQLGRVGTRDVAGEVENGESIERPGHSDSRQDLGRRVVW